MDLTSLITLICQRIRQIKDCLRFCIPHLSWG